MSLANLQRAGSRTTLKTLYHYINTVTMRSRENKISHYGEKTKQLDKRHLFLKKENVHGTGAPQVALVVKNPPATARDLTDEMERCRLDPWLGKIS